MQLKYIKPKAYLRILVINHSGKYVKMQINVFLQIFVCIF